MQTRRTPPGKIGLYDPRHEHDSCGVSFVANLRGVRSNALVRTGLTALTNLEHRGATGAESDTGDGAGILLQVPDALYRAVVGVRPPRRRPLRDRDRLHAHRRGRVREGDGGRRVVDRRRRSRGARLAGPPGRAVLSRQHRARRDAALSSAVRDRPRWVVGIDLDRKAFVARKRSRRELAGELETYFASLSSRTVVYKGMLTTPQLSAFFPDLLDPRIESALLIVHSPLLDQHVPGLVTGPPVPFRRPQRRDQHGPGQRELDAGTRGVTGERPAPRPR